MQRKTLFIAALLAAFMALAPSWSYAQSGTYGGSWDGFSNSVSNDNSTGYSSWSNFYNTGTDDNFNGGGSWGSFNNSGADDNFSGGGSWGLFHNVDPNTNFSGDGSWGNFTNEDPGVPLGSGIALLTIAGMGYACAKRRKAKKA